MNDCLTRMFRSKTIVLGELDEGSSSQAFLISSDENPQNEKPGVERMYLAESVSLDKDKFFISSIACGSDRVDKSPSSLNSLLANFLNILLIILPDLVFGKCLYFIWYSMCGNFLFDQTF
ncbi:hypothetical protein BpHYR1_054685 [Brachionus plicatilis]|uniref:Uncharacterized protein n=1 Tax=Brachionus plicatilis TaxID=10195 RepID=A0A3M7SJ08_BRAPC|nr:hypothetical protein BpHYR1_054685 [Brachionus plicatilis]